MLRAVEGEALGHRAVLRDELSLGSLSLGQLARQPLIVHSEGEAPLAIDADARQPVDGEHGADGATVLVLARDTA